jgi:hypothetical protein
VRERAAWFLRELFGVKCARTLGCPAAGGSGKAMPEPELTPQGWNLLLPFPAVPGDRHGFHRVQSPRLLAPSMLYVRSACSAAASPPPRAGAGGVGQLPALARSAGTG